MEAMRLALGLVLLAAVAVASDGGDAEAALATAAGGSILGEDVTDTGPADDKVSKLEKEKGLVEDQMRQADFEHRVAIANQKHHEQVLATVNARGALDQHRVAADHADALLSARAAHQEQELLRTQGTVEGTDIPDSPEDQIDTLDGFDDDISKMQGALATAEANTSESEEQSEAADMREQVKVELAKIDSKAQQAKLDEEMGLKSKESRIAAQESELESEISELEDQSKQVAEQDSLSRQAQRERIEVDTQKAQQEEEEKEQQQLDTLETEQSTLNTKLNSIATTTTGKILSLEKELSMYKAKLGAEKMKHAADVEQTSRESTELKDLTESKIKRMRNEYARVQDKATAVFDKINEHEKKNSEMQTTLELLRKEADKSATALLKATTDVEAKHSANDDIRAELMKAKAALKEVTSEKTNSEIEYAEDKKLLDVAQADADRAAGLGAEVSRLEAKVKRKSAEAMAITKSTNAEKDAENDEQVRLKGEESRAQGEAEATKAKLQAKEKRLEADLEASYSDEQARLARVNKDAAAAVEADEEETYKAEQETARLEHKLVMEKEAAESDFQRKKAEMERAHFDKANAALSGAKGELNQFKAQMQAKVHEAEMQARQVEAQAKEAQMRALGAVEAAKQETATKLAASKAKGDKDVAIEQSKMLEELENMESATEATVRNAKANEAEAEKAAQEAEERAATESAEAKEEAQRLADMKIKAIQDEAREGLKQTTAMADKAKGSQIQEANSEAAKAQDKAAKAEAELQRVEDEIQELKDSKKLSVSELKQQLAEQDAHIQSALKVQIALKRKLHALQNRLKRTDKRRFEQLAANDKLRAFLLVYKATAENQKTELHRLNWQNSETLKEKSENQKNLKVAKQQAEAAREENFALKSTLDTLERQRSHAVQDAATAERTAAALKMERQSTEKKAREAKMLAEEASQLSELNKLKSAAMQAAAAATKLSTAK